MSNRIKPSPDFRLMFQLRRMHPDNIPAGHRRAVKRIMDVADENDRLVNRALALWPDRKAFWMRQWREAEAELEERAQKLRTSIFIHT